VGSGRRWPASGLSPRNLKRVVDALEDMAHKPHAAFLEKISLDDIEVLLCVRR
jgi:hypothetical protein